MNHTLSIEQLLKTVPIAQIRQIQENTVYTILEKFNLCGSIKVKPVYWMLKKALERGDLSNGKKILEASSGNTAIALSYMGKIFGFPVSLIVPVETGSCKKKLMRSYGADLIEVDGVTDDCIDLRDNMVKKDPDKYFVPDQFNNEDNMDAHYNLTAPYIIEQIGEIDFFIAGLGTTGTLLGTGKYLKERYPSIKIIAVNPLDRVEGIKNYNTVRNVGKFYQDYKHLIDEVINVTFNDDVTNGVNDYLSEGYFNGISSGAILSATKKYLEGKSGLKGVIVAPDGGDYYFSEIFPIIDTGKIRGCE
ncbi:PLP-dependent cysteine synthase family protein [Candidatus Venteria ishoeyi]|uniref:cysteine synthase n=1 Tax=Candidatus Venteria ishoeyi TaxID=1899563 RepID=A0A1H6FHS6_9GAMM|nr:pyridoxal-phosphate dependent enzyme [Candidatus Venteria ishoeyi]MDM8546882.1 pyridoxal-phosphate dependent enzyme [Candidatus Venteria ishoeyi]SEH08696.1 Cysteine synthase B [Candidatus Venteria ishoeyi]